MIRITALVLSMICWLITNANAQDVPEYQAKLVRTYKTFDARQAVAVGKDYFYALDSFKLTKHNKLDGKAVVQWDGEEYGKVIFHLDSGMLLNGKLYASHSNYGISPMTSSVEVWDANTLKHIESHSFGIYRGSFTWLDRYNGSWWGAFANYDKIQDGSIESYGKTVNTKLVKMDGNFNIMQSWILPNKLLDRMSPMSNSGGSWGPDGYLYLTAHDYGEIYVMKIPDAGSIMHHVATVNIENALEGQGIAWDRTENGRILWGIRKETREVYKMSVPKIDVVAKMPEGILRRDHFNQK